MRGWQNCRGNGTPDQVKNCKVVLRLRNGEVRGPASAIQYGGWDWNVGRPEAGPFNIVAYRVATKRDF